ncbi:GAF domain-containing sensor histidine kinase [Nocardioides sp. CFH 31398]|uniref:sensor histidine kinase n=1 Tax=Nocardioides sp. CFH 31398 TaxID=2919579 RepID=UPI001F0599DB|nr:GAF domain-containing sensor histidine kinase [Nocardioides sp. CFH 31398]MCH1866112.1 GAF domain-containing sensor histidine kinase [Nocardioides sp. CFH 31398]
MSVVEETSSDSTTYRIHRVMADAWSHTALKDSLQVVADGVVEVVGFGVAAVSVLHDTGELEVVALSGDDGARDELLGTFSPLSGLLEELTVAEHWGPRLRFVPHERLSQNVSTIGWVPDYEPVDDPDAWHPMDLLIALITDDAGEIRGSMSVDLPDDGMRPGPERRRQLETYAEQAARAIVSAVERARLGERVRLADTARKVVREAAGELSSGPLLDAARQAVVDGFDIQGLWLRTFDDEDDERQRANREGTPIPAAMLEMGDRIARACWEHQRALMVSTRREDWLLSPEEHQRICDFLLAVHVTSILVVPLGAGQECLGVLALARDDTDPDWSDAEIAAALEIGQDLGRALLTARLFERERKLVDELQQLDAYKSRLIATVSHELKTPLSTVIGHVELLDTDDELSSRGQASVQAIGRGAHRLHNLVNSLLMLAKVGDPHNVIEPVLVDIGRALKEVAQLLEMQADDRDVTFDLVTPQDAVVAHGDPYELDQLVTNLASNAVKYSGDGGRVELGVEEGPAAGTLTMWVSDEGLGISESDQQQLFAEFFRSTNPQALAQPGTGLGLTIVARIVERHHGRIEVDSELGVGTTFRVTLPLAP